MEEKEAGKLSFALQKNCPACRQPFQEVGMTGVIIDEFEGEINREGELHIEEGDREITELYCANCGKGLSPIEDYIKIWS